MFSGISEKLDRRDVDFVQNHVFNGQESNFMIRKGNFVMSNL